MDHHDTGTLLSEYVDAQMTLLQGSGLLAAVASGGGAWISSGPTDQLRDDLLSNLDRFDTALVQLGDSLYPPVPREVVDAARALRALLEPWCPPEISAELGRAAAAFVSSLAQSMFAPPATQPPAPPTRPRVDDLGLPLPRQGLRTLYSAPARVLLVTVQPAPTPGQLLGDRIFVRRIEDARYREIVLPGERIAAKDVIVCAGAPLAYIHAMQLTADGFGADDGGIFRVELPDGSPEPMLARTNGGWISSLLGASADGTTLHVTATGVSASSPESCAVGYRLASVDVATGDITDLAPLPGIFA